MIRSDSLRTPKSLFSQLVMRYELYANNLRLRPEKAVYINTCERGSALQKGDKNILTSLLLFELDWCKELIFTRYKFQSYMRKLANLDQLKFYTPKSARFRAGDEIVFVRNCAILRVALCRRRLHYVMFCVTMYLFSMFSTSDNKKEWTWTQCTVPS